MSKCLNVAFLYVAWLTVTKPTGRLTLYTAAIRSRRWTRRLANGSHWRTRSAPTSPSSGCPSWRRAKTTSSVCEPRTTRDLAIRSTRTRLRRLRIRSVRSLSTYLNTALTVANVWNLSTPTFSFTSLPAFKSLLNNVDFLCIVSVMLFLLLS